MALYDEIAGLLNWMGWYILPFVAIMSAIVFFHELGHYLVGKWCGVKIEAFSLGFGPELASWTDRAGTHWRIALFPLGGYVKFLGDADAASTPDLAGQLELAQADRGRTLSAQPLIRRAAIVAAGPAANFLLALVVFAGLFMALGRLEHTPRIGYVEPNSAAARAGFQVGDLVTAIDGQKVATFQDIQQATMLNTGLTMTFVVDRNGKDVTLEATPRITLVDEGPPLGKRRIGHLGLGSNRDPKDVEFQRCTAPQCVAWAGEEVGFIVHATGAYAVGLFAGRESVDQVSGPIAIAQIAGAMAKISIWDLVNLAGLFSVSVGLMNLLPIPLLDGGHLLFYALEALRGRPLSERVQQVGLRIGIALVASLVIFTTSHDIIRLFSGAN
ncbi:MAG: M50 family metallopeptidase [Roseiarcus sp.]